MEGEVRQSYSRGYILAIDRVTREYQHVKKEMETLVDLVEK